MRFFSLTFVVAALASLVAAQANGPNAFNVPVAGYLLHAGQSTTFTWSNKAGSTVTLLLRDGSNGALNPGTPIASNIANTGSYTWNVPSNTVEGNSYTIEIINDDDTSQVNYTPQFDILSSVLATPSSGSSSAASTLATSTGSASSAAASTTGTASTTGSSTSTGTASSSGTATASPSSSGSSTASGTANTAVPTTNPAPVVKVAGSLLAVAFGFAVAF